MLARRRKAPRMGVKETYDPEPNAQEKAFHEYLMLKPCVCGCERLSTVVHHILCSHPMKRWRRDHEIVVPMWWMCHVALHQAGSENAYIPDLDFGQLADYFRLEGVEAGLLVARNAA